MNADAGGCGGQRDATLAVVVGVVDGRNPQMPDTMRTTATLLGVSAGAATADQLARVAVSADLRRPRNHRNTGRGSRLG